MIGRRLAHYKILERIGGGGMGEVFRALDTKLNREVALKILPPELAGDPDREKRFEREALTVASLRHPNIVTIHSVEEAEGIRFLIMELVEGHTLADEIGPGGVSLERFFELAVPLADAVAAAHAKGITHRDLKPGNVMVDENDRIKVLDFGLAKLLDTVSGHDDAATLPVDSTEAGKIMGTVAYMSPEQAEGKPVDTRSDVFSLGILFYEMITGERPFAGETRVSTITSILRDTPLPLNERRSALPHHLGRIVNRCLAKSPDRRFQSVLDLRNDLRDLREEVLQGSDSEVRPVGADSETTPSGPVPTSTGTSRLKILVPAGLVAVALVLILVFKPFGFRFEDDQPVAAAENTIAVMYFENMIEPEDPQRLGEILSNLLITDLSESQSIRVLSNQRLYDLLRQEGKEGLKRIDRATATGVAMRAGAKWMLLGSLLQTQPRLLVTSQVVDSGDGTVVSSQRVEGKEGESVFAVAARLASEIREDLSIPGTDASLARTLEGGPQSEEAYRYFLAGREADYRYDRPEAIRLYRQAIAADSTFAMAYGRLANLGLPFPEGRRYAAAAMRHIEKVSDRDQHMIRALWHFNSNDFSRGEAEIRELLDRYPDDKEALILLGTALQARGRNEESTRYLERAIEVDPMEKVAYNELAYAYKDLGDTDKSIWAINQYIRLAPDEPNPYDSRGDLYAHAGKLDEAIASYRTALEKNPDFVAARRNLFFMHLFKRDYPTARVYLDEMRPKSGILSASQIRALRALPYVFQGRFAEAIEVFDQGIAADRIDGDLGRSYLQKLASKGVIHWTMGNFEAARRIMCEEAPSIADPEFNLPWCIDDMCVGVLARMGDFDRAEDRLEKIGESPLLKREGFRQVYPRGRAFLARERGNSRKAIDLFKPTFDDDPEFWSGVFLAEMYLEADRFPDAVEILARLAPRYTLERAFTAPISVRVHYLLGKAYEASGWNDRAAEQYTEFLAFWGNGDPGIPEVMDAEERLTKLEQEL